MKRQVRISDEETLVLQSVASIVPKKGLILEIGAAWGWSISRMAAASSACVRLVTIDPWTLAPQKQQPAREARFFKTIEPYVEKITPIRAFSQDVEWDSEIDLLFIDGNHQYQSVLADYLKFSPWVKDGGWLVFHDYHEERAPDVTRMIDEIVIPSELWDWHVEYRLWIGRRI